MSWGVMGQDDPGTADLPKSYPYHIGLMLMYLYVFEPFFNGRFDTGLSHDCHSLIYKSASEFGGTAWVL